VLQFQKVVKSNQFNEDMTNDEGRFLLFSQSHIEFLRVEVDSAYLLNNVVLIDWEVPIDVGKTET
jgi:hypothetical protein